MDGYRLYCMDATGRIDLAEWIDASSDEDAIQQAKALKNGALKCEIWQGDRLVAMLGLEDLTDS